MMRITILIALSAVGVVSTILFAADADALSCDPLCYNATLSEHDSSIEGVQSELKVPDLFIKNDGSCNDNYAVTANWIHFQPINGMEQWLEVGVVTGGFEDFVEGEEECITTQQAYYAYQYVLSGSTVYKEIKIDDVFDPADNVRLEISNVAGSTWKIKLTNLETGDVYSPLQYQFSSNTVVESAQVGIEGTVKAWDENNPTLSSVYSTVPEAKFSSIEKKIDGSWVSWSGTQTQSVSTNYGYKLQRCDSNTSLVAGTVTETECNPAVSLNGRPAMQNQTFSADSANSPITITLSATDSDGDYIQFWLASEPEEGTLSHTDTTERIPNTTPTTATITYAPPTANLVDSDTFRVSATDGRDGHEREVTITINPASQYGQTFSDDFESDLSLWTQSGYMGPPGDEEPRWVVQEPIEDDVPDHDSSNMVLHASDCDSECIITMDQAVDLTGHSSAELTFWRMADGSLDENDGEYARVQVSSDGGSSWSTIYEWDERTSGELDGNWHFEEYDLSNYLSSDSFKVRFAVLADKRAEDVEFDDVRIGQPDTTSPVITILGPNPQTVEINTAYTEHGAAATDNVDGNLASNITVDSTAVDTGTLGTYTVTYSVSDSAGNTDTEQRTVIVSDTTPPVMSAPADVTAEATGTHTTVSLTPPTVTDNSGESITPTNNAPAAGFPVGTTTVTWSAADSSGNTATVTQQVTIQVTIQDTTSPVITILGPNPQTVEINTAYTEHGAAATDNVDGNLASNITVDSTAVDTGTLGTYTVTYSVSDSAGNTDTEQRTVIVSDTTPPVMSAPADVTAEATGTHTTVSLTPPTVTDNSGESITPTNNAPAAGFPVGTTTVTWSAADSSGNTATVTQQVTIQDTTSPAITPPADYTAEATAALTPLDESDYGTATATDNADPNPVITKNATATFPLGDTVIEWKATDSSSNTAVAYQTITIQDTTAPALTLLGDSPTEVAQNNTYTDAGATCLDDADGDISSSIVTGGTVDTATIGTYTITYDCTDAAGNDATQITRTVEVVSAASGDTIPPTITISSPSDSSTFYDSDTISFTGSATDNEDGNITSSLTWTSDIDGTIGSGGSFTTSSLTVGNHAITASAADNAANTGSATITVTINLAPLLDYSFDDATSIDDFEGFSIVRTYEPNPSWPFDDYAPSIDTANGQSQPSALISGDGFGTLSGMKITIDLTDVDTSQPLNLSFDWRAKSDTVLSSVTNARIALYDADGQQLHLESLVLGGTTDSGWNSYGPTDISDIVADHDSVDLVLLLNDSWIASWNQKAWFDNIRLISLPPLLDYSFDDATSLDDFEGFSIVRTYEPNPSWPFDDYAPSIDTANGQSQPSALISGDGFGTLSGMKITIDLTDVDTSQPLNLSFDWRAKSDTVLSSVTNARIALYDADGQQLHLESLVLGGTTDSGWNSYGPTDISDIVADHDSVDLVLLLNDSWIASWNQKAWFDNIRLISLPSLLNYSFDDATSLLNYSFDDATSLDDFEGFSIVRTYEPNPSWPFDDYAPSIDTANGQSQPSALISGDGFGTLSGMKITIDLTDVDTSQPLNLSFDWRAKSDTVLSSVTNARIALYDADGQQLHLESLVLGGTTDSGWNSYGPTDISDIVADHDSVDLVLLLNDSWIASWNQKAWFDNIRLISLPPLLDYSFDDATSLDDFEGFSIVRTYEPNPSWPFDDYAPSIDTANGQSQPSALISGDGFGTLSGMKITIDLTDVDTSQPLNLSFDWRAKSDTVLSSVTNARIALYDADGQQLHLESLVLGGTTDSGWNSYGPTDISDIVADHDSVDLVLLLNDSWIASWNQKAWFDNIRLISLPSLLNYSFDDATSLLNYSFDDATSLDDFEGFSIVRTYEPNPSWPFDDYAPSIDTANGQSQPSALISGDGFGTLSGMKITIDLTDVDTSQPLNLSFDWRAKSDTVLSSVTNARIALYDADGQQLHLESLVLGGTTDSGWNSYGPTDISDIVADHDSVDLVLLLNDSWIASWNQKAWFDNILLVASS